MFNIPSFLHHHETAYTLVLYIFCVGIFISSLEYLAIHKEFKINGIFSWKIFSSRNEFLNSWLPWKKINFLFGYRAFIVMHALRIASVLLLPFIPDNFYKILLLGFLAISSLLFSFRSIVGLDGADQMNIIITITLFIVYIINVEVIYKAGLIFIAAQSILSYMVAGIAKLRSAKWRGGQAVFEIMNTRTYGYKSVAIKLANAPRFVNIILCWLIIFFEIFFIILLFLEEPWLYIIICCGIIFHLYNAIAMGLNNFFWAFLATYPALLYVHELIH
jgi:hypothetical protein